MGDIIQLGVLVKAVDHKGGYALNGQVIVLVGVHQSQDKVLAERQMAVEVEFRRDGKHHQTVAEGVAVLAFAVLQYAHRVGQAATPLELAFQIVVGLGQIVTQVAMLVVGVGRKERSLGQSEEAGCGNDCA